MKGIQTHISASFAQRGRTLANLAWIGGVGLAAPVVWGLSDAPGWMTATALAAAAFPAIVGLAMGPRLHRGFEQFVLVMIWSALAAAVAALGGGLAGAPVLAFLLAPAALAAGGTRGAIVKAGALSAFAAVVTLGLQIAGFIPAAPQAAPLLAPFVPGAALMIAIGFSAAAIRAARTHDNARAEAEHGRLRAKAFDASPAALLACDAQGNILAASAGMRTLSPGLPRRLDSLPAADLGFDDPDRAGLETAARDAAHRPVSASYELRGEHGRACVAQVETAPIEGGSVIVFAEDVAADAARRVRQAEAERDAAIEEARAKSQYLASVSHELRTPLNAIIGFSDVMKARLFGPLPARYSEYAQLIHESGRHLMELIGDVLDMSKIEADRYELVLEKFDVGEVIGICTKLMRLQAEESGLTLSADGVGEAIEVTADRKALRQIILNLLSNAVKFTPEGGAVVVMARASGDDLVLAVGDSGVGIAPAEIDRLGRPYQQAGSAQESTQRGTGLGLSLVRALAELHGGRMTIVSRQGEGTTVTLTLPILAQRREAVVEDHPSLEVHDRIRLAQTVGADLAGEREDDRASASS